MTNRTCFTLFAAVLSLFTPNFVNADTDIGDVALKNIQGLQSRKILGKANVTHVSGHRLVVYGPSKFKSVTFDSLSLTGPVRFKGLYVKDTTDITGPLKGANGTFNVLTVVGPTNLADVEVETLSVTGPLVIRDSTLKNTTKVVGPINAVNAKFSKVEVTAPEVSLTKSIVGHDILVRGSNNQDTIQKLYLKEGTVVKGDVRFESEMGEVILEGGSKVEGKQMGLVGKDGGYKRKICKPTWFDRMINWLSSLFKN